MRRISEKSKIKKHRGKGTGANYKPWIYINEINSQGTATAVVDYKHGRTIQLLSQGEVYYYYLLRWQDDVVDIREQYPLDLELTTKISDDLGFKHPKDNFTHMTTDLLVTKKDNTLEAYSIKTDKSALDNPRTLEKLYIEKLYWEAKHVPFHLKYKADINRTFIHNIIDVTSCYDINMVHDVFGAARYKIAHKDIIVDMETSPLNYKEIIDKYLIKGGE